MKPNPVTGIDNPSEAAAFLREQGVQSFQGLAGYKPLVTDAPLPETEQSFSERTRASRQTRHIRVMKWINFLNIENRLANMLSPSERAQVEFITYQKYLESEAE